MSPASALAASSVLYAMRFGLTLAACMRDHTSLAKCRLLSASSCDTYGVMRQQAIADEASSTLISTLCFSTSLSTNDTAVRPACERFPALRSATIVYPSGRIPTWFTIRWYAIRQPLYCLAVAYAYSSAFQWLRFGFCFICCVFP